MEEQHPLLDAMESAWAARMETIVDFVDLAMLGVQRNRRRNYALVLRWLAEHGAIQQEITIAPATIAASRWIGCSERTVQRAIAFFQDSGILKLSGRCDDAGSPLPPSGRLLWGAVLARLGREPEGTVPLAVSLENRPPSHGSAPRAVSVSDQSPADSPPTAPDSHERLPGMLRDPARILACVRAYTTPGPDTTSIVDDEGRLRVTTWSQVREAAEAAERIALAGVQYPVRIEPPALHQLTWLSLTIFSPRWLLVSAEALNRKWRREKVASPHKFLLGILRCNLVSVECLPDFESEAAGRTFLASLTFAVEPWIRAQIRLDPPRWAGEPSRQAATAAESPKPTAEEQAKLRHQLREYREKLMAEK